MLRSLVTGGLALHAAGEGAAVAAHRPDLEGLCRGAASATPPPLTLHLRGGGKDKDMHKWVMKQVSHNQDGGRFVRVVCAPRGGRLTTRCGGPFLCACVPIVRVWPGNHAGGKRNAAGGDCKGLRAQDTQGSGEEADAGAGCGAPFLRSTCPSFCAQLPLKPLRTWLIRGCGCRQRTRSSSRSKTRSNIWRI
jgi:hypothetical protein